MKKYDQNVKEELYNVYLIMGMLLNQTICFYQEAQCRKNFLRMQDNTYCFYPSAS